jgi:predicted nuclease with TOPRIM domain
MSRSRTLVFASALCVLTFCLGSATTILAQTNPSEVLAPSNYDKTIQQLLAEVRELRLAVQRATFNHTRFQVVIERLRLQQSTIDGVNRQMDLVRAQLADLRNAKPQMEQQIKETEELVERASDPNGRLEMESQIKSMKARLARLAPEEDRLRNRETALESELHNLHAKLNELNSQLDVLFNEMKAP